MHPSFTIALVSAADLDADTVHAIHVTELARALGRLGHRVTVYTRRQDETARDRSRLGPGATLVRITAGPARPLSDAEAPRHIREFADELARRWSSQRPDVVHAHGWVAGLAAYAAAEEHAQSRPGHHGHHGRIPVVQSYHGLAAAERRWGAAPDQTRLRLERVLGRCADAVLAGCGDEVTDLVRLGVPRKKIGVAPYGVDGERFRQTGPTLPRGQRQRLVTICRDLERGGVDTAIRTLVHIPDAELVVVGGPSAEQLQEGSGGATDADPVTHRLRLLAKELHVADRVIFLGRLPRKDLPRLLRTARLALCLAPHQPPAMVPLEAMACGVPVVTTPAGAGADSVLDRITGLHVPADRPAAVGRAIRLLLAEETTLAGYAIAAADRAHSRYGWDRVAAETARSYAKLLPAPEPAADAEEAEEDAEGLLATA